MTQGASVASRWSASRLARSNTPRAASGSAPSRPEHQAGLNSTTAQPRPSTSPTSTTKAGGKAGDNGAASSEWDNTPIDFSGLRAADADLVLKTEGYSLKGADVGPTDLSIKLAGGNLNFASSPATFFGGTFSTDLNLNASAATPTIRGRSPSATWIATATWTSPSAIRARPTSFT